MSRHDTPPARSNSVTVMRVMVIVAVTLVLVLLVPLKQGPAEAGLKATTYALAATLSILLFRPQHDLTSLSLLAWCAAGVCLAAVMLLVDSTTRILLPYLPRLLLTLFLLAATFSIATRYIPTLLVVTIFALLTLMPIWAAPLAEVTGNPTWLNEFIVNACPLTAIAIAIDLDYLRSEWFYANSALGSMRYSYPGWSSVCLLLAVLPAGTVIMERLHVKPAAFNEIQKEAHP